MHSIEWGLTGVMGLLVLVCLLLYRIIFRLERIHKTLTGILNTISTVANEAFGRGR